MKYITYAVIAALMFGMAIAPSIHDGLAFAQNEQNQASNDTPTHRGDNSTSSREHASMENKGSSIDKKEMMKEKKHISVEKKQVSQDKKEMTIEKKKISKEKRSTNLEEKKSRLMERYSTMSNDHILQLQNRLQHMQEAHDPMKEKLDAGVALRLSFSESERDRVYQNTKEQRLSDRMAQLNQSPEQRAAQIEDLKQKVIERRYTTISPYVQVILGSDLTDVICPLDRYLVIRNSDGMPNCMSYYTATTLINRGLVSYPE